MCGRSGWRCTCHASTSGSVAASSGVSDSDGERRRALQRGGARGAVSRARRQHRAQQVARRLRARHDRFGQAHAEAALDAQEQLDAPEAVEAVVLLEAVIESGGDGRCGRDGALREAPDQLDQCVGSGGGAGGLVLLATEDSTRGLAN